MIQFFYMTLIMSISLITLAQDIDRIDVENHPLDSFPQLTLTIGELKVPFYGMDSRQEAELKFIKETTLELSSEVPLSGYIFSKEFVESFRISKTMGNKKKS